MQQFSDIVVDHSVQPPIYYRSGNNCAANDNAAPRDDFLTILDAGIDPVGLLVGLRDAQDVEQRFLDRLRNLARALRRCDRRRAQEAPAGGGSSYADMTPEQAGAAALAEAQAICHALAGPARSLPAGAVGYADGGRVGDVTDAEATFPADIAASTGNGAGLKLPYQDEIEAAIAAAKANGEIAEILVFEGAWQADGVHGKNGIIATAIPDGAIGYGTIFRGARVVIIPINDADGRQYRDRIAAEIAPYAASVLWAELPGLNEGEAIEHWWRKPERVDVWQEFFAAIEGAVPWVKVGNGQDNEPPVDDWRLQIIAQMKEAGIEAPPAPDQLIADGRWHRFAPVPGRKGQTACYSITPDPIAPSWTFKDWRMGGPTIHGKATPGHPLTPEEAKAWRERAEVHRRRVENELAQFRETEAMKAEERWQAAAPAPPNYPYLRTKRVKAHGLRMEDGCLLVPRRDVSGKLWSVMKIYDDGFKMHQEFARAADTFYMIGDIGSSDAFGVVEGYATAATVFEAHEEGGDLRLPTVSAGDAGNLLKVALILKKRWPNKTLYIGADDDWLTKDAKGQPHNTGRIMAEKAASATGGILVVPRFDASLRVKGDTDFNDEYRRFGGLDADARGRPDGLSRIRETFRLAKKEYDAQRGAGLSKAVTIDDFHAYMPMHQYIFVPTRELWAGASLNGRFGKGTTVYLDVNKPVEQMTWSPGEPMLIHGRIISDGGWSERGGVTCFNLYRPPTVKIGDARKAGPWIDHVHRVYPNDADHIITFLAHRRQRPHEKINHGLLLGGAPGVGKDTLLEPLKYAVGSWNFKEASPQDVLGQWNDYLKSVVLRISEARDLGEFDRFQFYDHMKSYTASPPDVLRISEKYIRQFYIQNVTGVIMTTNHKTDGIYLPADDRRTYVAWTELGREDFDLDYWNTLWSFYYDGGIEHVVAYLDEYDLSGFDPKAPPRKTDAFWAIVDAGRPSEDADLSDALDRLGDPLAVTIDHITTFASASFVQWLTDRKNRKAIGHRLHDCGYEVIRNPTSKDGYWVVNERRQTIYARIGFSLPERLKAAGELARTGCVTKSKKDGEWVV